MTDADHPITAELHKLRGYALHLSHGNPADAEDLVQDTVERCLRLWPAYAANMRSLTAWMRLVCYQEFCRRYRVGKRRAEVPIEDATKCGDMRNDVAGIDAGKLLQRLSPPQRQAIERVYLQGESAVDLADELDCPRATVRTRVYRALHHLRSS